MKAAFVLTLTCCLGLLLGACASTQPEPRTVEQMLAEKGYNIGPVTERIPQFRFTGWQYLDRQHVMLNVSSSRHYLVSLRTSCNGLYNAHAITFSNSGNYLSKFDSLSVRDNTNSTQPGSLEHCLIESINELVSRENQGSSVAP